MKPLTFQELQSVARFLQIVSVWIIEEVNTNVDPAGTHFYIQVDWLDKNQQPNTGFLAGSKKDDGKKYWKDVTRAVETWRKAVPTFTKLNIQLLNFSGEEDAF